MLQSNGIGITLINVIENESVTVGVNEDGKNPIHMTNEKVEDTE